MPIWTDADIVLTPEHLPRPDRWPLPENTLAAALSEARHLLSPQVVYRCFPVLEHTPAGPLLPGGTVLHSQDLLAMLGPSGHLLLSICTIGPHLEARGRAYSQQGDLTRSLLLDALGTAALGELSRRFRRHLAAEFAPQGLSLGGELSPGQMDWPLQDQAILATLLHPEQIGVHLNERGLMVPLKSVSSAIVVGPAGDIPPDIPACDRCPRRRTCPYRLKGQGMGAGPRARL